MRVVTYRKPVWSADGATVFLGLARWDKKVPTPKDQTAKADK
jgi:hypothetical protein